MENLVKWFEQQAFGVCAWWGEKLNIRSRDIRIFFIYSSFLTLGSPVLIYMAMAFILNLRNRWKKKSRLSVWDL